jgi:ribose 1,5-bisphosphokinase PhnN
MWKDLARRISDAGKEEKLDIAKRLVRYMFSQTEANLK